MSYIKIEFGGRERGFKFNQLALEIMTGLASSTESSANIYAMFYGGLRGNSYVKREEPDYTFEQVCDWVDALFADKKTEVIKQVEEALTETQLYKSLITPGPENKGDKEPEPTPKKKK